VQAERDDRIFLSTRMIAAIVVPFLVLAWVILFWFPQLSGERFAWQIQPPMTAVFMGAGYLGGSWLFINAIIGKRWHAIQAGFLPVTAFTWAMLAATILHWERFDFRHLPFLIWFGLYVVTPFLVPWMWLHNRGVDPGAPGSSGRTVPAAARWGLRFLGGFLLLYALAGFIFPDWLVASWVWKLSPLTARIMSGWFALLGVGGLVISSDARWSAWRVGIQAIGIWHALVLVGALMHAGDFTGGLLNWYTISVALALLAMAGLFVYMERMPLRTNEAFHREGAKNAKL
jgi:hypothetical protein